MMNDFSNDSLAKRRSFRLQEVERLEAEAVGRAMSRNVMILDTDGRGEDKKESPFQRSDSTASNKSHHTQDRARRPSDTEIRSLWRLRVNHMKLDDLSTHSSSR